MYCICLLSSNSDFSSSTSENLLVNCFFLVVVVWVGGWWALSLCFAQYCVSDYFWNTTKKPPIGCIDLSSLSASRLQVCLSSCNWRCDSASCSCPCIQHKDAKDVCTFLSFFFLPPKWSSLHKSRVNPFKYAQQTRKCVMFAASLVTYSIFSLNHCLQKLLHQVTSAPVLRGFVWKNVISNPHWDYFWHTTKSLHFAVLIYLH